MLQSESKKWYQGQVNLNSILSFIVMVAMTWVGTTITFATHQLSDLQSRVSGIEARNDANLTATKEQLKDIQSRMEDFQRQLGNVRVEIGELKGGSKNANR